MITYIAEWDPRLSCWAGRRQINGVPGTLSYKSYSPAGALQGIQDLAGWVWP